MKEKNKKRSWKQIVSILSCIVVFCTTYALILPAVTLSTDTFCGKEEHTHSEKCYRSETPLCGLEEGEGSEGHTHTEDCYGNVEVGRNLICGMEEVEGHVHDDSCYQSEFEYGLICGKEESEPTEGHVHNENCYKSEEPICGKEEHTHSRECYSNKEDVEDPKDWEEAYKDINKEEDAKTRILTVAKNEVGYKENEANFSVDENDKEHYYTRYGHLYEDMYGDWNNYFTGYVLKYANVKMNFDKDISKWQNKTIDDQIKEEEKAEEGNVVFFRDDEGELRSGIVTKIDSLTKEIRVIEGDVNGEVKEERINRDKVIAYLSDEITIEDEDTPLAGDGVEKEESNASSGSAEEAEIQEKRIEIDGKDQVVQVGDWITLTANETGFEDTENLTYQWQYNPTENCEESAWTDIEYEVFKSLNLQVTEENQNYYWRVVISQMQETDTSVGTAPENSASKLSYKLLWRNFETEENIPTETIPSEEIQLMVAAEAPNEVSAPDIFDTTKENKLIVKKKWSLSIPSDINEVTLELRVADKKELDSETNQPKLVEEEDPNTVLAEIKVGKNQNGNFESNGITYICSKDNPWEAEVDISSLNQYKFSELYITEKPELDDYYPTYERSSSSTNRQEQVYEIGEVVNQLQYNGKYIIVNSDKTTALGYVDGKLESVDISQNQVISSDLIWNNSNLSKGDQTLKIDNNVLMINNSNLRSRKWTFEGQSLKYGYSFLGSEEWDYLVYENGKFKSSDSAVNSVKVCKTNPKKVTITSNQYELSVTNSPYGESIFGQGGDKFMSAEEIIHSKTIDYLGDGKKNADANYPENTDFSDKYRLYLDAGPISGENPVNLVLIVDDSGSMDREMNSQSTATQGNSRMDKLKKVLFGSNANDTGLIEDFLSMNPYNTITVYRFAQDATLVIDRLSISNIDIIKSNDTKSKFKTDGGTNYQKALNTVSNGKKLQNNSNNYVIFLSDGEPTFYGDRNAGPGSRTSTETAEATKKEINDFKTKYNNVPISTIMFGPEIHEAKVFLETGGSLSTRDDDNKEKTTVTDISPLLSNGGTYVNASSSNEEVIKEQLRLLAIGPRCKSFEITDTLSDDVEFDNPINITVKAISNKDNTKYYLYNEHEPNKIATTIPNNDLSGEDYKNGTHEWNVSSHINPKVAVTDNKITLTFDKDWSIDPTYRYEISFNIRVKDSAYDKTKLVTGDANSDYRDNKTSSGKEGLYSNAHSSLTYTYKKPGADQETTYSTESTDEESKINPYQRPVVQIDVKKIQLLKKYKDLNGKDHTLANAEFSIYVQDPNGANIDFMDESVKVTLYKKITSDKDGVAKLPKLEKDKTYYLIETKSPDGFSLLTKPLKIISNGNSIQVYKDVNLNGTGGTPVNVTKSKATVTFDVFNEPGQSLPNTGGAGTKLFTFSGAAVIAASGLMYGYKKKKDKRNGKGGLRK